MWRMTAAGGTSSRQAGRRQGGAIHVTQLKDGDANVIGLVVVGIPYDIWLLLLCVNKWLTGSVYDKFKATKVSLIWYIMCRFVS